MTAVATSPFDVAGRVVVITGAVGRLGRTFSRALADQGARVAAIDVVAEGPLVAEAFGSRVRDGSILPLQADVTDRRSLASALERIESVWGVPHALVNNAAIDSPPDAPAEENGPFESYPEASWERVLRVNTGGVLLCCQVFGSRMAEVGAGAIVNIGSIYGVVSPDQRLYEHRRRQGAAFFKPIAYSASKAALLGMTRYLATYWAPRNVRVNTLVFGGVFANQDEEFLRGYCARVPLGRMAREEDYVGPVQFLVSQASSYMTGANLVVDGGFTAW